MASITVDEATAAKVAAGEPVVVRAPDGRWIGIVQYDPRLEPPGTPEEWDREVAAGGGRSLADIMRDLEARG